MIGEVENFINFDLNAGYVEYVDATHPHVPPPPVVTTDAVTTPSALNDIQTLSGPAIPNVTTPFVVDQTANPTTLLQALFSGGGFDGIDHSQDRLDVVGDARAFGTFSGDPFGLGQGIVLSTGQVEDLVGPNTRDGGLFPPVETSLSFTKIGRYENGVPGDGSDIYMANIADIGSIASIVLHDSNTKYGGGGGIASGFDIDSVFISTKPLSAADIANINDPTVSGKLNAFDFSPAGIDFQPGSQRPPDIKFGNAPSMEGASGNVVLNGIVNLNNVGDLIPLSLGDGGSIGFNLNPGVLPTSGPLISTSRSRAVRAKRWMRR